MSPYQKGRRLLVKHQIVFLMVNDTRQLVVCNLKAKINQMAQYFTEIMNNSATVTHVIRRKKRAAAGQPGALISNMSFLSGL